MQCFWPLHFSTCPICKWWNPIGVVFWFNCEFYITQQDENTVCAVVNIAAFLCAPAAAVALKVKQAFTIITPLSIEPAPDKTARLFPSRISCEPTGKFFLCLWTFVWIQHRRIRRALLFSEGICCCTSNSRNCAFKMCKLLWVYASE